MTGDDILLSGTTGGVYPKTLAIGLVRWVFDPFRHVQLVRMIHTSGRFHDRA